MITRFLSVLAWILIGILTVLWVLLILIAYLVSPILDPRRRVAHGLASAWGRNLVLMAPGCRVQVFGRGHIPVGQPVILMANHQSYADIPVLYFLRCQFKWMADVGLFRIPFFGWAMAMAGYIPVNRGNPRAALRSLEQAKEFLSKGMSIFVFPEGTRSHTGLFGRFQTGGFRLAVTAQIPIVPIVLVGTRQLLPRDSWMFRPGVRLQIHVLPPVLPAGSDPKEVRKLAGRVRSDMKRAYHQHLKEFFQ